ncbi:MAG TPA: hypothetical protein VK638_00070, partial [Edaphobacter sp.]|nr:hypothetical protein [Edaphobacter sp.]
MNKSNLGLAGSLSFAMLIVVTGPFALRAQVTAAISGHVEDVSGGAISNATVTVKNMEIGAIRVVTT